MDWTAERIVLLKRLRDDGVSYSAIAAQLGITRGAVSGKVDRLGLATREPAPRGPRKPRPVLKTRSFVTKASDLNPGVPEACGASFNPHPEVRAQRASKDAGPMVEAQGPFIHQSRAYPRLDSMRASRQQPTCDDAREEWAPQVEGFGKDCPGRVSQDEAAGRDPADPSARTSRACSLLELTEGTCRWPVGDVGEPGFFFCGEPPLQGAPYCGPHCRKAFRPFDAKPVSEFAPDRDAARVLQPDTRFGQFAHWDVT